MKKKYLLTNRSKSQYYNVVRILGEYVVSTTLHKCNAIVYFEAELSTIRQVLADKKIVAFEEEITKDIIPDLLDMEL